MRIRSLALILLISSTSAFAAEKAAERTAAHGGEKSEKESGAPGTNVDMPFLMAPMFDAKGDLAGYAYLSSRVTATSPAATAKVREKIAFIQDAFLRDVNGARITRPDDPATLDMPGIQARLLADAKKVMGAGAIASLTLVQAQIAPLHPQETQAQRPPETPPPEPEPAKAQASPAHAEKAPDLDKKAAPTPKK